MKVSPNTLELAADLQALLIVDLNANTGDDHAALRAKIITARADLSALVLGDLHEEIAAVLKRRKAAGR